MNLGDQRLHRARYTRSRPDYQVAVVYPAQFFPVFGSTTFDDSVTAGASNLEQLPPRAAATATPAVPAQKRWALQGPL